MENKFLRRSWAEIDLEALRENYRAIRARVPAKAGIMSVVKADAYGHGSREVAAELEALGSDAFAVSNLNEGIDLRECGITKPILILGNTPAECADKLLAYDIATAVSSFEAAQNLSSAAERLEKKIKVHVKAETGMGRLGVAAHGEELLENAKNEILKIGRLNGLSAEGIFTHFATADESCEDMVFSQYRLFYELVSMLEKDGMTFRLRHCSNSAACIRHPEFALDMVRPGIVLYGLSPDNDYNSEMLKLCPLSPVMTLKSVISQVSRYDKGCTISYGAKRLERESEIAVVSIGYADGFSRCLSDTGMALIRGIMVPVVGKVCMDMTMFDVTGLQAAAGDEVIIFGKDAATGASLPTELIACASGTIAYEVVCRVGQRVPRVYINKKR
jgi:alanine racemase